jgi:hypothetical protein
MPDESPHFTTDPVDLDAIDARIALFVCGDAWVTWRTSTIAAMSAELRELRAENERLQAALDQIATKAARGRRSSAMLAIYDAASNAIHPWTTDA